MAKILLGSKKHGWEVDEELACLSVYELLNMVEKTKGKTSAKTINFKDIQEIEVWWGSQPVAVGRPTHTIAFTVRSKGKVDILYDATGNHITKDEFILGVKALQRNNITFIDKYDIVSKVINTEESIWSIIEKIEKVHFQESKK